MRALYLLFVFAFVQFVGPADAQIGWSKEEIVKEFGEPVGDATKGLLESDGTKADVFTDKVLGFDFNVEYKDNIAWVVTFHGRKVRRNMAASLVATNCGPKVRSGEFLSGKYWIEKEKKLRAFYYSAPMPRLVVMTEKSLESAPTPREIILKALPSVIPSASGNAKKGLSGTKNDPLARYRKGSEASSEKNEDGSKEEPEKSEDP
ncbi:MAG: hypothetical protein ACJ0K4_02995 [Verrucomicrobiales bacterium]